MKLKKNLDEKKETDLQHTLKETELRSIQLNMLKILFIEDKMFHL